LFAVINALARLPGSLLWSFIMRFVSALIRHGRIPAVGITACVLLIASSGCGPDLKARGIVRGKVKTGNQYLTSGSVMFINTAGVSSSATIMPDGSYEMLDAPVGECKISVTVQNLPMDPSVRNRLKGKGPAMPAGPRPPDGGGDSPMPPSNPIIPKTIVPIDQKYSDPETSGLKFTVQKGEQTHNIDL
jgi:hypothetical protein